MAEKDHPRNDLLVRTFIWLAVVAVWAYLNKPEGEGFLALQSGFPRLLGAALIAGGIGLYAWTARLLADGAPITSYEPMRLLTRGPYGHVRNPLYLAIAAILAGVSSLYGAWSLRHLVQAAIAALGAHLVVVRMEEPATRKRLGAEYEAYCRTVPRWVPRLRRAR